MPSSIHVDRKVELKRDALLGYRLRNNSGGTVNAGNVVVYDTSVQGGDAFTTTASQDSTTVAGVLMETVGAGAYGFVAMFGHIDNLTVNGTTAISVGDMLTTYTSAGIAAKATAAKGGVFAIALEAYAVADSNGVIDCFLVPAPRYDASASVSYGTGGQMAADGIAATNAAGSTNAVARIDHAHAVTNDTPALVFGTSNAVGTVGKVLPSDATIAIFDATVPTTDVPNATAAAGSAAFAARRDHVHGMNTSAAPADGSLAASNAAGTNTNFSRSDHAHKSILLNDVDLILGTTDAAATASRLEYDTAETVDALKLGLDETSRRLILLDYGDMGSDTTLSAATNPELVFMNAAFTKWLKISNATAGGVLDVITGNNLTVNVAGTTEYTFDATNLTVASGNFVKFAGNNGIVDSAGNELLEFTATGSALNGLLIINGATGNNAQISAAGTGAETNTGITLLGKGTGNIVIDNGTDPVKLRLNGALDGFNSQIVDSAGNVLLALGGITGAVNYLTLINRSTGQPPEITTTGTDTDVDLSLNLRGAGLVQINNDTDPVGIKLMGAAGALAKNKVVDVNGNELLELVATAAAVNHLVVKNAATGGSVELSAVGTGVDGNTGFKMTTNGTGVIDFNYASVALGAGGSATLGTVGGSGPAATAQNAWLSIKIAGTASYVPFWR